MLLQQAVETGTHPLAGTAAEWIWLVLALPLLGAALNGLLAMITEWHPGPFDPDPVHTGEHETPQAPTLVERAERGAPGLMTVIEGHAPYHPTDVGGHGEGGDLVQLIDGSTSRVKGLDRELWSPNPRDWCVDP